MGRAKVASVTARPQARDTLCPNFCLFVLFIFKVSLSFHPTYSTIYLSHRVSIKRPETHTNCVTLQAGVHKRLEKKKPQRCIFSGVGGGGGEKVHASAAPVALEPECDFQLGGGQRRPEFTVSIQICAELDAPRSRGFTGSSEAR